MSRADGEFPVYGIDFTSFPARRKPLTCAEAVLRAESLIVQDLARWEDFQGFEAFLATPGPWTAGMDFAFGQPRKLLETLGCDESWEASVRLLTHGSRGDFEKVLTEYRRPRPKGDKQHLRGVDELAKSCSPMMLYGVPVAKMFYEGAQRLLRSGASVLPMRPVPGEARVVVEAYPKLAASRYVPGKPYKAESRASQTKAHRAARAAILSGLKVHEPRDYDLQVEVPPEVAERVIDDGSGDSLDAVLCCVQAAWSKRTMHPLHGIPDGCDPVEGWIVDPVLLNPERRRIGREP